MTLHQLTGTTQEVGVNVRFGHRRQAQPVLLREAQVLVHIAKRIDDDRLTAPLAPNQIGILSQPGIVDLS